MQYLGITIMLILCSLAAAIEYAVIEKGKKEVIFYSFSAFFACYFFMLSAAKLYLGYRKENLFESFWDVQTVTFIHYGIPLLIGSIAGPFFIHWIFKENAWKLIRFFDSVMFLVLAFVWLFVRKMNNRTYCTAFCIAAVFTVIAIGYIRKNEITFVLGKNMKKQLLKTLPFVLYWFIAVAIYIPNELYLNNASDFPMSYWYFFGKLLLSSIIVLLILLTGAMIYLTEKQLNLFCTILFVFLIIGYVQGMFLNGTMEILDGTGQDWNVTQYTINLGIWIVLAGTLLGLRIWKKEKAEKIMQLVCIWLSLTQLVSLGVLMLSSEGTAPKSELLLTTDGMLEVGEEDNIIVFVLDKFDGRRMDDILEEDADFLKPLKDFTYYTNMTSAFSPTENSIPFLLTGAEYDEETTEKYITYAYDRKPLIKDISSMGYDIGLYTDTKFVSQDMKDIVSNYKDNVQRNCDMWELFALMTQCSRYRMAPFIAKNYYQYDSSDVALLVVDEKITNIENDLPFYNKLMDEGLRVNENMEYSSAFRFIHMHGAHPPYIMSEEFREITYDERRDDGYGTTGVSQAKGALKIVYEYIRQLQELGKYDDAMIIITADHGYTDPLSDKDGNMQDVSFPILLVKEPYDNNQEQLMINKAPVCHADLAPTIRNIMGMQGEEAALKDIAEDEERSRIMRCRYYDSYEKYEISGDVREVSNWKLLFKW